MLSLSSSKLLPLDNSPRLISSSSLINIPEQFSYLSSALNTDQLISEGSLKHLFSQNNLIEIPPIISSTSISTDNCRAKGVFEINGIIDKSIDTDLSFYIKEIDFNTKEKFLIYEVVKLDKSRLIKEIHPLKILSKFSFNCILNMVLAKDSG